jgi:succinoglycan biosynthesis transport protein ExoP
MSELDSESASGGLNVHEVLYTVFKHKWKIILCAVAGIAAAAGFYFLNPPLYQSDAKVLMRYFVDRSAVDSVDSAKGATTSPTDSAMNSEVEILTSWDLYEQVVEEIGAERLLPNAKGSASKVEAAKSIGLGLTVTATKGSNVILVSYKNSDPELAKLILDALLTSYYKKHLEIHRSIASFDLVSQQTEIVRGALTKTEEDLKAKKAAHNITSLPDTEIAIDKELADTDSQIDTLTTDLAGERAFVAALERSIGGTGTSNPDTSTAKSGNEGASKSGPSEQSGTVSQPEPAKAHAGPDDLEKYQVCLDGIAALRKKQLDLRATYTLDSRPLRQNLADIVDLEKQRHDLERKFPDLLAKAATTNSSPSHSTDYFTEKARLDSMVAKMESLKERQKKAQERAKEVAQVAPEIEELERERQLEQASYTSSRSKLDSATTDEKLDPSKMPNMNPVQKPSPPMKVAGTRQKIVLGLAGGGIALGFALALISEIVLDQTIKRPMELEKRLRIPLLLSIPLVGRSERSGSSRARGKRAKLAVAPWEPAHFIRSYSEAIRDRLNLYFEVNNLRHKPKLIAVTGFSKDSGASTLAGGLAAALSETGDGKVLLVDMNAGQAEVHPFFQGRPACSLTVALQQDNPISSAAENLYLATGIQSGSEGAPVGLKRFHDLMPDFKGSDFDYIIFDMPPVGPTSPTSSMARFMDRVLFVLESERCNRDVVKRSYAELLAARGNVAVVLNKVRSYAPKWIEGEI